MNRFNAMIILKRKKGEIDFDKKPFHRLSKKDPRSLPIYNVAVKEPCVYAESVLREFILVLCWKDQYGEQREFSLRILEKDFNNQLVAAPYSIDVEFVGFYKDFLNNFGSQSIFLFEEDFEEEDFVVYGKLMGAKILLRVCETAEPEKDPFHPKTFKLQHA